MQFKPHLKINFEAKYLFWFEPEVTQLDLQMVMVLKETELGGVGLLLEEMPCRSQALWVPAHPHSARFLSFSGLQRKCNQHP